jgi:uncharacterized protein (DUF736 family)
MAIIGTFTSANGNFKGTLQTLGFTAKVEIRQVEKSGESAPDYRVYVGKSELGAGWRRTSKKDEREYVSVKIDDPSFAAPLYANLIEHEGQYDLMWSRSKAE